MPKKVVIEKRVDVKGQKKILAKPKIIAKTPLMQESKKIGEVGVEQILLENFVSLQKVMVNLSVKMDNLTMQISQLLNLFEITARSLAEKKGDLGSGYEKRMMEKMDNIVDQNKTIARGISFLHEPKEAGQEPQMNAQIGKPLVSQPPISSPESEAYQRSISSKPQGFNKLPQG